ncbi:hypothetical protein K438DRAFT_1788072 [Mycena galopus ATCC 62051]|nr:hypothetical protein K438DRAFT_1788072 [Mycena galopus ATCC 62051]
MFVVDFPPMSQHGALPFHRRPTPGLLRESDVFGLPNGLAPAPTGLFGRGRGFGFSIFFLAVTAEDHLCEKCQFDAEVQACSHWFMQPGIITGLQGIAKHMKARWARNRPWHAKCSDQFRLLSARLASLVRRLTRTPEFCEEIEYVDLTAQVLEKISLPFYMHPDHPGHKNPELVDIFSAAIPQVAEILADCDSNHGMVANSLNFFCSRKKIEHPKIMLSMTQISEPVPSVARGINRHAHHSDDVEIEGEKPAKRPKKAKKTQPAVLQVKDKVWGHRLRSWGANSR